MGQGARCCSEVTYELFYAPSTPAEDTRLSELEAHPWDQKAAGGALVGSRVRADRPEPPLSPDLATFRPACSRWSSRLQN